MILIDTSAWIGFFAKSGHHELKGRIHKALDQDQVATAGPIALELMQGCRSLKERVQLEELLRSLHWLPAQDHHWFQAGEMAFTLRRKGITISAIDGLIATLAEAYHCTLLGLDRDFEYIAQHTNVKLDKLVSQ